MIDHRLLIYAGTLAIFIVSALVVTLTAIEFLAAMRVIAGDLRNTAASGTTGWRV